MTPWLLGAQVAALSAALLPVPVNNDVGWLLTAAREIAAGARPYVDIVETNPPLILWLYLPAGIAGDLIGVPGWLVLRAATLVLAAASVLATALLLRRLEVTPWLSALYAVLAIAGAGFEFAQREHLLLLVAVPYATSVAYAVRIGGGRHAGHVLPAAAAAVGIALKPFFLLLWLGIEGFALRRLGRARLPAVYAAVGVWAAYGLAVFVFARDFFAFARDAAPLYPAYRPSALFDFLFYPGLAAVLLAGAAFAWNARRGRTGPLGTALLIGTLAMAGSAILQAKTWHVHWYPAVTFASLLAALEAAKIAVRSTGVARAGVATAFGIAVLIGTADAFATKARVEQRLESTPYFADFVARAIRSAPAPVAVFGLTARLNPPFPAVTLEGARWVGTYGNMWMLPALYRDWEGPAAGAPPQRVVEARRALVRTVARQFTESAPDLLIVDRDAASVGLKGLDLLGLLQDDPVFEGAFRDFRLTGRRGAHEIYRRAGSNP